MEIKLTCGRRRSTLKTSGANISMRILREKQSRGKKERSTTVARRPLGTRDVNTTTEGTGRRNEKNLNQICVTQFLPCQPSSCSAAYAKGQLGRKTWGPPWCQVEIG
ncbi:unnamed protein product [Discosporangium mesarthrocarpum]